MTRLTPSNGRGAASTVEYCPVEDMLSVIRGRWKPYILWCLLQGPMRTSELSRSLPQITQKMLTQHLRELERDGVVGRTVFPEVPPRVEYRVTELGLSLGEVLVTMCHWSSDHMEAVREARANYAKSHPAKDGSDEASAVRR